MPETQLSQESGSEPWRVARSLRVIVAGGMVRAEARAREGEGEGSIAMRWRCKSRQRVETVHTVASRQHPPRCTRACVNAAKQKVDLKNGCHLGMDKSKSDNAETTFDMKRELLIQAKTFGHTLNHYDCLNDCWLDEHLSRAMDTDTKKVAPVLAAQQ
ncbi:hypothetical protein K438DRAFT_1771602 [Mycena galopus ATCC 62051]|nr:hypothetical protein K438DRAFT_1771602 [Mycena galopus ATCC 62051]